MTFEELKSQLKEACNEFRTSADRALARIELLRHDVKEHDTEEAAELGRRVDKAREALVDLGKSNHEVQVFAAREAIERLAELLSSFGI